MMPLSVSTRAFVREKPDTGRLPPVVVNTNGPANRGNDSRISTALDESGTNCSRSIFARPAGMSHSALSRSNSDHDASANSRSRTPVNKSSLNNAPNG